MSQLARSIATVLVIAIGCPVALYAGVNISCAGHEQVIAKCADNGLLMSPALLTISGLIAAFLARGLLGFVLGAIGIVLGMAILWIAVALGGQSLPLDIAQAVIATIWFGVPSVFGYMVGRALIWGGGRVRGRSGRNGGLRQADGQAH